MKRRVRITFDAGALIWTAVYYQVDGQGNEIPAMGEIDYSMYERTEEYGNQLYNGELEVVEANGIVNVYRDGCHLVQREMGMITSMSKEQYAEFSGRPGSENED